MLSGIAIVPSAPVMVPELAGAAAAELDDLRVAVVAAAQSLPSRWIAIGVGPADTAIGPQCGGTFAGYGVDVRVKLSPDGLASRDDLPLCGLIAGWIRGQADPRARVDVRVYAETHTVETAVDRGRRLRAEIDRSAEAVGVLIVADGANTLTPPAPGGYHPESIPLQQALDDALAAGDAAALTRLPAAILGRVAHQVLAGLVDPAPRSARELYRGAPYGVGYFVGLWRP